MEVTSTSRSVPYRKFFNANGSNFRASGGDGANAAFDKATVKRLQDVQKLSAEEKAHVYAMLDAFLLKSNIQQNLGVK